MKLSDWARKQNVSYKTAWRWFHNDELPCDAVQLESGTILVEPDRDDGECITSHEAAIYTRVSSHDQKKSLNRQVDRLRDFCAARGLSVSKEVKEVGSGLNGERRKLNRLLSNPSISPIVVEHRDRLARFGVPMVEAALESQGREILVVNQSECEDDIVQDFVDIVTSMCARIYGKRSAQKRAEKAMEAADEN